MKQVYRDQVECLEAIGGYLVANVPGKWERIDVKVEILEGRVVRNQKRFQSTKDGALQYFRINDIGTDLAFGECFLQLSDLIADEKTGQFKGCHYVLHSNGQYHVDYEY
jgi:hypothetical protein